MFKRKSTKLQKSWNFEVFYRIFSQRKMGVVATSIIVSINFIQINIFLFQSFRLLTNSEDDIINFLNNVIQYFYMASLANLIPAIYIVMRSIAFIVSFAYFFLFLVLRHLIKTGKKSTGVERIFELFNTYFTMILLLPFMDILFGEVLCNQDIMEPLGQVCRQGAHLIIWIFSLFSMIFALIMSFMTVFYSMNGIYDKKNYLSGENKVYEGIVTFIRVLLTFLMAASTKTQTFTSVYLSINLVCSFLMLLYFIFFYPYNKDFVERFSLMWLTIYFIQSLSMLFWDITGDLSLSVGYVFALMIVVSIPAMVATYQGVKVKDVIDPRNKSISHMLMKIQNILQLKQNDVVHSKQQELYFRGIIVRHQMECNDPKCFCKQRELYDPKKKKNYSIEKFYSQKPLVIKYFVKALFEKEVNKDKNQIILLISYADFLFQKFRNTHLSLFQLLKIEAMNKFLYPHHRYKIFKLLYRIQDYVTTQNNEALEKELEIESVLFVEEQFDRVQQGMQTIIKNSIDFWAYLQNQEIDLNKLRDLAFNMNSAVESTNSLWHPLKPYLYKQKRLLYYYNWFLKDFLQKKILISEEEVDDLHDEETYSVHSHEFIGALKKGDNVIFQENSSIIHMSGNNADLGKIIKTNKGTPKIFGFSKDELVGINVSELMPKIIGVKHNSYLENYIKTGKSKLLYSQKRTFARHKQGFIVPIWIIVKQYNQLQGQVEYVGLLKPLTEKKDEQTYYMLCNNMGEICGMTKNLQEFMPFEGDYFEKVLLNIIMLAPKLIKYFYFGQILTDDDDEHDEEVVPADNAFDVALNKFKARKLKDADTIKTIYSTNHVERPAEVLPFMKGADRTLLLKNFLDLDKSEENLFEEDDNDILDISMKDKLEYNEAVEQPVEFTIKIPKKLDKFIKEFDAIRHKQSELLNNQNLLASAILKHKIKEGEQDPAKQSMKAKFVNHVAHTKHNVDSYLQALKVVSTKIYARNDNEIFRVKGFLITDTYGPDEDIVKYLKITDIQNKTNKYSAGGASNYGESTTVNPNLLVSRDSDVSFMSDTTDVRRNVLPFSRPSHFKGNIAKDAETTDGNIEKDDDKDDNIQRKSTIKSKKEEEEEENRSAEDEAKELIINELKNSVSTQYQSIYHKDDNMMIEKSFPRLNNVKWFIEILFFIMIPINIIVFVTGANSSFGQVSTAIQDIQLNEELRKTFLRAHDSIITILLNNSGYFNQVNTSVASASQITAEVQLAYSNLEAQYQNLLTLSPENQWTDILFQYVPEVSQSTNVNYQGALSNINIETVNAIQKLQNNLAEIASNPNFQVEATADQVEFYRFNSFDMFDQDLSEVSTAIFNSFTNNLDFTSTLSIDILIVQASLYVFSLLAILRLIIVVIKSLREILETFLSIENKEINVTENYYHKLMGIFQSSMGNAPATQAALKEYKTKDLGRTGESESQTRTMKKAKNPEDFMKGETLRLLGYYIISVILGIALSIAFHVVIITSVQQIQNAISDSRIFIGFNSVDLSALVAGKELFYNNTEYSQYVYPYMYNTFAGLNTTLNTEVYQTNLEWVSSLKQLYKGEPCIQYASDLTEEEIFDCNSLEFQRLASGLIAFHSLLSNRIEDFLLKEPQQTFGNFTMNDIYEFSKLIDIVDGVFLSNLLNEWEASVVNFINQKLNICVVLLIVTSLLQFLVFIFAEKAVVGVLNTKFLFYRKIYNSYMLGALENSKKIAATLRKHKLLSK